MEARLRRAEHVHRERRRTTDDLKRASVVKKRRGTRSMPSFVLNTKNCSSADRGRPEKYE